MKRILHAISQYPGKTGSGTYLMGIIKEAYKKGYKQALIAGVSKENNKVDFGIVNDIKFYPVIFETDSLPFPIVGMSDIMPYKSTRYSDMDEEMFIKWEGAFKENIIKAINEFKPDIIIAHHLWLLTSLIKKICDIPVISISHGTDLRQLYLADKFRDYVVEGCKNVEVALTLNEFQGDEILKNYNIYRDRIHIIGAGYDSDIFYTDKNIKKRDKIRLIYAGKLSFSKGVPSLIKAYSKLFKEYNNLELFIAGSGSGSEERFIRELAEEEWSISFLGAVPHDELGNVFRECDIFILPSFYEGLPIVTIEALASGLLVVVSEIPGLSDFIGEEVNKSGVIEYVKLPAMEGIDTPKTDELISFEERLIDAVKIQIQRIKKNNAQYHCALKKVESHRWSRIFGKIEEMFNKFD